MGELYRSGLQSRGAFSGRRIYLALGGHHWVLALNWTDSKWVRGGLLATEELPEVWRCVLCYELVPRHYLDEGFYSRPCMGRVRALEPAS